jgi:hypothetical protein
MLSVLVCRRCITAGSLEAPFGRLADSRASYGPSEGAGPPQDDIL